MASLTKYSLSMLMLTAATFAQSSTPSFSPLVRTTGIYPLVTSGTVPTGSTASPTGPVIAVTFPGGLDNQKLVASLIGTASSLTTLAVTCPDGTDDTDCGFPGSVTITVGSTSLHLSQAVPDATLTVEQDCKFSSGGGTCVFTEIGQEAAFATDTDSAASTLTNVITTTSTSSFAASDIMTVDVTVTAGAVSGVSAVTTATGASGAATASAGSSVSSRSGSSPASHSGSSTSASGTATSNDAVVLIPGAFGAALMGLAAVLL